MAKKQKERIKVELNLPRDDKTESNYMALLVIGVFLGAGMLGFWFSNSFWVGLNKQPQFVNIFCGFDETLEPTWEQNQTCLFTKDSPTPETWSATFTSSSSTTRSFEVPGIEGLRSTHPAQELEMTCHAKDIRPLNYTVQLRDPDDNVLATQNGLADNTATPECRLNVFNVPPGDGYKLSLTVPPGQSMDEFDFTLTVHAYDGTPALMNNRSKFIGPELDLGAVSARPLMFLNWFAIGLFFALFPASWYRDLHHKKIQAVEEKFPDFLRDLAEYWKGGLSMTLSVRTLANSEYGALNDEIQKMADQISWGVAFQDVLDMFAARVGTPLIKRAVSLINEANKAGGKISDILVTAANDTREIKFLEAERKRAISSYIAVIWTSFMVFLGVIVVLARVFIPAIASSNSTSGQGSNIGNMEIRAIDPLFFLTVFFYGVCMQAVGNGAMAGLMATGRFTTGFKHAGMMIVVALFLFNFVAFTPDLIGVPQLRGLNPSLGDISGA